MSSGAHAEEGHHGVAHYTKILIILMVLAFVSYIGPQFGIKAVTLITAFGIAVVKAFLVIKHFMHLTIEKRFVGYFLLASVAFMFLFFFGVASDVLNHRGRNWENVSAQTEVKRALTAGPADHHGGGHGEGAHGAHTDEALEADHAAEGQVHEEAATH